MTLWNNDTEIQFFTEALKNFASPEQLFYNLQGGYFAYVPKGSYGEGKILQSRNSLIGQYTEKWCKTLFEPIANELGLHAVNSVVCDELGLSKRSSADLAFCTTNNNFQKSENIKLILDKEQLLNNCKELLNNDMNYFSSMISKSKLGEIIRIASQENTDIAKAEKFLTLIRG
jgi:hypothetical protein